MKVRNVQIVIQPLEGALKEAAEVFENAKSGKHVNPIHKLGFPDIATFRKVLTEERLRLLKVVRQHQPGSIYELAKLLNRDLKSVNTDVNKLRELDLIQLKKSVYNGRRRTSPKVTFDNLQLNIAIA